METTTPTELTLGQRLAADTPTFFKKVELFGLGLLALGGGLSSVTGLPAALIPAILGVGTTLTVISKFAVKDTSVLTSSGSTPQDYIQTAVEIPKQIAEVKQVISNITTGPINPIAQVPTIADTPLITTANGPIINPTSATATPQA